MVGMTVTGAALLCGSGVHRRECFLVNRLWRRKQLVVIIVLPLIRVFLRNLLGEVWLLVLLV